MFRKGGIFYLAYKQLEREGKLNKKNWKLLWIDKAVEIRKWLDKSEANKRGAETRLKKKKL